MMNWYKLTYKIEDNLGVIPSLAYDDRAVKPDYYQDKIQNNGFWKYDEPIFLRMFEDYEVPLIARDVNHWSSGRPWANIIACSSQFIRCIKTLEDIPLYNYYPAKLRIKENYYDNFVFHYLHNMFDTIDYTESQFALRNYGEDYTPVFLYRYGELKNSEHIRQINREQFSNDLKVTPIKLIFRDGIHYDIWSLYGQHIISEKAMLLFKEAGITGIDMIPLKETEWKHLEIVMPQTQKLSVVIEK